MPGLNLTEKQFRTSMQSIQSRFIKIELLNYQFQTVDSIEGKCTSGSISIDANSDIRRTGNVTLTIDDSSFEVEAGGKIWLDKYLRVWIGNYDILSDEIVWNNCGIYIIDAPSYNYDSTNNTLTISLLDLMAKLTGVRNGYSDGTPVLLSAGESIREAIITIIKLAGFTNYIVDNPPAPGLIPNNLEFGQGATVYEVLKGLCDIYPDYEMFFDINGTFVYQKIPNGKDEQVMIDDTLWDSIVMSESITPNFQNVKNSIEVYGRTHDPEYFSTDTTLTGSTINLTIENVEQYTDESIYGFVLQVPSELTNFSLKINELPTLPVKLDDGVTNAVITPEGREIYYCIQYKGTYWNWLGHLQAHGKAEDTNPNSPFYINGTVGKIRLPLFDGDYANIYSDDLARQRAEYELYLHANMNDSINLTCVPVYWADVNILVNYTTKRNNTKSKYIIKSVNFGLAPSDTMTVSMIKFYPSSPYIILRD